MTAEKDNYHTFLSFMPRLFLLIILLLNLLPILGFFIGYELDLLNAQLKTKITFHTVFYWSLAVISLITSFLAFNLFFLSKKKIALSFALSYFFCSFFYITFTITHNWTQPINLKVENIHAYVWLFTNNFMGLFFLFAIFAENISKIKYYLINISCFLMLILISAKLLFFLNTISVYSIIYKLRLHHYPFGLPNFVFYLSLAFLIWYKQKCSKPNILISTIFLISISQCLMSLNIFLIVKKIFDTGYILTSLVQFIIFLIPLLAFIIIFLNSYFSTIDVQSKLENQKKKYKLLATTDFLTGLYNRRNFVNHLNYLVKKYKNNNIKFTLFFFDLDNLKNVNDSIGHEAGDQLIVSVAERVRDFLGNKVFFARLGGDEFGLVFLNIDKKTILKISQDLLALINRPYQILNYQVFCSASIGAATFPDDGNTANLLIKNADSAMYYAKLIGRNSCTFYNYKISSFNSRKVEIETAMQNALQNKEFYLRCMPIYHLKTRKAAGAEMLIGWNNDKIMQVPVEEYINISERIGLINIIGNWVMEESFKYIKKWEKYNKNMFYSINVSLVQLTNINFFKQLENLLNLYKIKQNSIEFEITETTILRPDVLNKDHFELLAKFGIKLALDDFGTGYTNFERLFLLPIDTVKIGHTLFKNIHDKNISIIIESIIKMVMNLKKTLIIEGITNEDQLKYLISKKCPYGQGYLLSKPLTPLAFERLAFL